MENPREPREPGRIGESSHSAPFRAVEHVAPPTARLEHGSSTPRMTMASQLHDCCRTQAVPFSAPFLECASHACALARCAQSPSTRSIPFDAPRLFRCGPASFIAFNLPAGASPRGKTYNCQAPVANWMAWRRSEVIRRVSLEECGRMGRILMELPNSSAG